MHRNAGMAPERVQVPGRALRKVMPEAEGPMGTRQYRSWRTMEDAEVLALARAIAPPGATKLSELRKLDQALAAQVEKRGLCDALGLSVRKFRSWKGMGNGEFLEAVNAFARKEGIASMNGLWNADAGMADRVRARGLEGSVHFCVNGNAGRAARPEGRAGKSAAVAAKPMPAPAEADAAPAADGAGQESAGEETGRPAAEAPVLEDADVIALAQEAIGELGLHSREDLRAAFGELFAEAETRGLWDALDFPGGEEADASEKPGLPRRASAEEMRKAPLRELSLDERAMYRLICADCFRVGAGSPYVGGCRATLEKLQSNLVRRLSGPQHRLLRKCWDRMVAEGAIVYNSSGTAASLDPTAGVSDRELGQALAWASAQQKRIGAECRA